MEFSAIQVLQALWLIAPIALYGFIEYRRREKRHHEMIQSIRDGRELPGSDVAPSLWQLMTTGTVTLILLLAAIGFIWVRPGVLYGGGVLYLLAVLFLAIFILLLMQLIKMIEIYRAHSAQS